MNIKNVYILDDRAILYINGEDTKEFLQNLISNDINKVSETNTCFASLLSPQGKFLYEFIIIKHKSGYLIDCEKSQADELYKQLSIYKLRSKVEILNLSNEFVVAAFSHEKFLTFDEAQDFSGFTLNIEKILFFLIQEINN
jgi:folate-binding Fe-S cluster repair protein YgfZ